MKIHSKQQRTEVCILAGGLSSRMGRDKAQIRIDGRTMLSRIRETAAATGLRVRVIRRDLVPRCGPIGGVITAFRRSRADALLFLACDMPFVTTALLRRVLKASRDGSRTVFASTNVGTGFPFLLPLEALLLVDEQRRRREFSLQKLAERAGAKKVRVNEKVVFNINTPVDLAKMRREHDYD